MNENKNENIIEVACAIIEDNGNILAARRSADMSLPLKWEFPGGKIEPGESPEDSIIREIKEELDIIISVKEELRSHIHDYGTKVIKLIPFVCNITGGSISCKEHKEILWGKPEDLESLDWADADVPILKEYIQSNRK